MTIAEANKHVNIIAKFLGWIILPNRQFAMEWGVVMKGWAKIIEMTDRGVSFKPVWDKFHVAVDKGDLEGALVIVSFLAETLDA